MILIMVDNVEELAALIREAQRIVDKELSRVPVSVPASTPTQATPITQTIPPRPCRLAVMSSCDRARPPHAFAIYDENGEILADNC